MVSPGLKAIQGTVGMLAGPLGFLGLSVSMKKFVDASNESEVASKRLSRAVGDEGTALALEEYATQLQKSLGISDEAVKNAATLGAQFGLTEQQIRDSIAASADLSVALGGDLQSNMEALLRAAETGQSRALKPLGISLDDTGSKSKNLAIILDQLNKKIGDDAETAANTGAGSMARFGESFGEFGEKIGGVLTQFITPTLDVLTKIIDKLSENIGNSPIEIQIQKIESQIKNLQATSDRATKDGFLGWLTGGDTSAQKAKEEISRLTVELEKLKKSLEKPKVETKGGDDRSQSAIDAAKKAAEEKKKIADKEQKEFLELQEKGRQDDADAQFKSDQEMMNADVDRLQKKREDAKSATDDIEGFFKSMATSSLDAWSGGLDKMGEQLAGFLIGSVKAWVATEIGKMIASTFFTAGTSLAAVPVAAAAGATATAAISAALPFEQGGIVPGNSFQGDHIPARVNSGEMVLTRQDQSSLMNIIHSGEVPVASQSPKTIERVNENPAKIQAPQKIEGFIEERVTQQPVQKFEKGGIVAGDSFTGDKVPARMNSGEIVLTRNDQSALMKMIRSGGNGGQNVVVNVDGAQLARVLAKSNSKIQRGMG